MKNTIKEISHSEKLNNKVMENRREMIKMLENYSEETVLEETEEKILSKK